MRLRCPTIISLAGWLGPEVLLLRIVDADHAKCRIAEWGHPYRRDRHHQLAETKPSIVSRIGSELTKFVPEPERFLGELREDVIPVESPSDERAIMAGRGNVGLLLTLEQYSSLCDPRRVSSST
jgi:hypothetical protein